MRIIQGNTCVKLLLSLVTLKDSSNEKISIVRRQKAIFFWFEVQYNSAGWIIVCSVLENHCISRLPASVEKKPFVSLISQWQDEPEKLREKCNSRFSRVLVGLMVYCRAHKKIKSFVTKRNKVLSNRLSLE